MNSRRSAIAVAATAMLGASPVAAEQPAVTAADWQDSCAPYLATLRGEVVEDDLKITYCVGQTKGIVEALDTGSQIGAVSFASTVTVAFGLDQGQVFALFEKMQGRGLLDICRPKDARTATLVETVQAYLEANPDKAGMSVAVVFFEALQQAFPCAEQPPADD